MSLNERLIQLRREKGLSQEQLAEKLDISRQAISKWETGESMPDLSKLLLLADIFGVSLDFMCGKDVGEVKTNITRKIKKPLYFIIPVILCFTFVIGILSGYFIHASVHAKEDQIINDLEISGFTFYDAGKGDTSRTLRIVFSTNVSREDLKYSVLKTDSRGKRTTYEAEYKEGVCICTVTADYYGGFTLTAVISDGKNLYSRGLIEFDHVTKESLSYEELWNK